MTTPDSPPPAAQSVLPPPPPGHVRAEDGALVRQDARTARARSRLLQLAVLGGSLLGMVAGGVIATLAGGQPHGFLSVTSLAALASGGLTGYLLGRSLFAIATRDRPAAVSRWGAATWLALATPAYLAAGLVAAGVGAITAGVGPVDVGQAIGGVGIMLLSAWVVVAPLTAAFAPSMTGRTRVLHKSLIGCSGTFWVATFATAWFIGSFMATLLVLGAAQAVAPAAYEDAGDSGAAVALMLVTWGALWLGGSAAVYRLVSRVLRNR